MHEFVSLEWFYSGGDDYLSYMLRPYRCHTEGRIVKETDQSIVIAPTDVSSDNAGTRSQGGGWLVIPKRAILTRKSLETP
jgi:hypothetical protein